MAIIYNYPLNSILLAEDMLIGTSTKIVNGQPKNATKNFSIADLTGFIKQNVSLNDVLLVGNTSLLDAKIGKLYLYDTPVADYGNISLNQNRFSFNTVTHGEVFRAQRDMFSSFSSSGYRGSFEVSNITANRVWDLPNKSGTVALLSDVPTLQEVTDEGNITTNPIILEDAGLQVEIGSSAGFPYFKMLNIESGQATLFDNSDNTDSRYAKFQNKDGTLAYLDDIPTATALPFTTDHISATGNQYVIGDVVYYSGNIYRCIASNDSLLPTNTLYWTNLGAGYPLVQQPSDWNATSGNNQILNKPTIPTTPTLQEVLDNNHDLVSNNNFQGTGAGLNNTGGNINAFGFEAAKNNDGESVNAFGGSAASDNIGININALGINAGLLNEGWHLNAFGENAGIENTFNNVNLLGQNATADENGQTVLSKDGDIMARISTTDLTETRKYNLPDADGTLALTTDVTTPTLQEVMQTGKSYIETSGGYRRIFRFLAGLMQLEVRNTTTKMGGAIDISDSYAVLSFNDELTGAQTGIVADLNEIKILTDIGDSNTNELTVPYKSTLNGISTFSLPNNKPAGSYTLALTTDTPLPSERRNANNSSNNNINYCGTAANGSTESSAVWTIKRLTIAASGSITTATAANVAWTNRESATYI